MGKKRYSNIDSESDNLVSKSSLNGTSKGKLLKSQNGRPKAGCSALVISVFLVAILSALTGLILIELYPNNKYLQESLQKFSSSIERQATDEYNESHGFTAEKLKAPNTPIKPDRIKESETIPKEKVNMEKNLPVKEGVQEPSVKKLKEGEKSPEKVAEKFEAKSDTPDPDKLNRIEKEIVSEIPDAKVASEKESVDKDTEFSLPDLYMEVESIAEEILQEDPDNEMVKQLAPHLEGVLKNLESGKLNGLRDSLLHVKLILLDLKERLADARKQEELNPKKESVPSSKQGSTSTRGGKEPVEEVIPEPVHIAPRGSKEGEMKKKEEEMKKEEEELKKKEMEKKKVEELKRKEEKKKMEELKKYEEEKRKEDEKKMEELKRKEEEKRKEEKKKEDLKRKEEEKKKLEEEKKKKLEEEKKKIEEKKKLEEETQKRIEKEKNLEEETKKRMEEEEKAKKQEAPKPKKDQQRVPVNEVIPEPVYIAPLGGESKQEDASEPGKEGARGGDSAANPAVEAPKGAEPESGQAPAKASSTDKRRRKADSVIEENPNEALNLYGSILQDYPKCVHSMLGRAKSLDILAEKEKSNARLEQAIFAYRNIIELADQDSSLVPKDLLKEAGLKCADKMMFRGFRSKAVRVLNRLSAHFPKDVQVLNKIGLSYLQMNQNENAKEAFEAVLEISPEDGFALAHYGLILKFENSNNTLAISYLERGIKSEAEGTHDKRFYYHLGDALQRLGQNEKAYEYYEHGAQTGIFLNRYQRSMYNVDRLSSKPVWNKEETPYADFFGKVESRWKEIRAEGMEILSLGEQQELSVGFQDETENLREKGEWGQFNLFARGKKIEKNCMFAPVTCSLVEGFAPAAGCKRGQTKFSLMAGGTHVYPHTGPSNCRLRSHLGLIVPLGPKMRVVNETLTWEEGKVIVFDDSFEHEVWHLGNSSRLILIIDLWHPDLTQMERDTLRPI